MDAQKIFSSKLTAGLLLLALAFVVSLKYRQYKNEQGIAQLKTSLQQQAAAQGQKNQQLQESISYLNSSDFEQRVAREQLDLKKNGEVVYDFSASAEPTTSAPALAVRRISNAEAWWNYFFQN